MGRLYVSDLDGTLLRPDASLSPYARAQLARLLDDGLAFTVASARSVVSMQNILGDLPLRLPVVEMNGAFVSELATGRHLVAHAIAPDVLDPLYRLLRRRGHLPFLSTFDGHRDRLYYAALANEGMHWYRDDRRAAGDPRLREVDDLAACLAEHVVSLTLIERLPAAQAMADELAREFPGLLATNLFENTYLPGWYWLTIHDRRCTKDQALATLLQRLGGERPHLVVFGDHWNDLGLFRIADTAVAVANAADELKAQADIVIGPHHDDSVVRYLLAHAARP
ncbi:MAG: HAD hydrolase family protein [Candidatus Brocadiia bacterium]